MIALETNQNPSRLIKHDGKDQILQQPGKVFIWRGEYFHGGALYTQVNRRLFVHVLGPQSNENITKVVQFQSRKNQIR